MMLVGRGAGQGENLRLVLVAMLVIFLLLQLSLWSGSGSVESINTLEREIETQTSENAVLIERNEALREEVSDLKTGLDSIEERARSELGLIKKGETFYLILEDEKSRTDSISNQDNNVSPVIVNQD